MMKKDCRNKPKSIFSRFFQRKQKDSGIDTSVEGFRYVGINLTEEQYQDQHIVDEWETRFYPCFQHDDSVENFRAVATRNDM
ncbi:hypothetical protein [Clostridium sp. AF29-8BH]|mgnify:FL=1|jgi:hypothetical protein|uniref:hypothetical protein n=1 Tax=Clostridium sp. AF29-8BH TaxID=2293009 RepID=UPI0011C216B9